MAWQDADDVRRLLREQELRIGRLFALAMQEYRDSLDTGRLIKLIERGRIIEALREIEFVAAATANASQAAFLAAAEATSAYIQRGNVVTIGFDQTNRNAVTQMQRNRLSFIKGFTEQQTRATRMALLNGVRDGLGPRDMARVFRGSIGLTEYQEGNVRNYKKLLQRIGGTDFPRRFQYEALTRNLRDKRSDPRIRRALRDQSSLSATEIDRMTERYREKYIKFRAEGIARTEALHSVHEGRNSGLDEAIRNGAVKKDSIKRKWNTAIDGRERDAHAELNGIIIGHGEVYTNALGTIRYPGDRRAVAANVIRCRCVETFRIR